MMGSAEVFWASVLEALIFDESSEVVGDEFDVGGV